MSNHSRAFRKQGGFSLFVGMIFLFILTLLGVGLMRNNVLQEKMAMNSRDRQVAMFAAESALADAGHYIYSSNKVDRDVGFSVGCLADGLCAVETDGVPIWVKLLNENDKGWVWGFDDGVSIKYGAESKLDISDVSRQPRFIIESLGKVETSLVGKGYNAAAANYVYRATARGFGRVQNDSNPSEPISRVTLQAHYIK